MYLLLDGCWIYNIIQFAYKMGVYRFLFYLKIISWCLFYYYDLGTGASIIRVTLCSEYHHNLRKYIEVISEFAMSLIIMYGLIPFLYYVRYPIVPFLEFTIRYHIGIVHVEVIHIAGVLYWHPEYLIL